MIVVVEGPSAAGKTTCAARLASASLVPETVGLQPPYMDRLRTGIRAAREALSKQQIGIADLVLCEIPEPDVLEHRKRNDQGRTRRRFELHRRLAEPLHEWYDALAELDPDRVQWRFPDALPMVADRNPYDLAPGFRS